MKKTQDSVLPTFPTPQSSSEIPCPTLCFFSMFDIQLSRQMLFHKSVKAYVTMPIGIMGRKSLGLIDWG